MQADEVEIARGRYLRLMRRKTWEYAERIGATGVVAIVPITDDRRIILTEQWRVPVQKAVIDLPAGLAGDSPGAEDEALLLAAQRELEEEVGYRAEKWTELGGGPPSPGMSSEVVTFFKAEALRRVSEGGGVDESENITVHVVPLADLDRWLTEARRRGALIDLKVHAGLHLSG